MLDPLASRLLAKESWKQTASYTLYNFPMKNSCQYDQSTFRLHIVYCMAMDEKSHARYRRFSHKKHLFCVATIGRRGLYFILQYRWYYQCTQELRLWFFSGFIAFLTTSPIKLFARSHSSAFCDKCYLNWQITTVCYIVLSELNSRG